MCAMCRLRPKLQQWSERLSQAERGSILALLKSGNKIMAIRELKQALGLSIREAVLLTEALGEAA